MKRTFRLSAPGKDDARVRDKIRHEINKYVKRERRKGLPEGQGRWQIRCRLGHEENAAQVVSWKELGFSIDAMAETGAKQAFVEVEVMAAK